MYLFYFCYTAANDGQRRPTQGNEGQRRPTERKTQVNEGPQRPTTANDGQRRPMQVNEGPQRPTTANEGQCRPTQAHTFRPYVCFFFVFCSKLTILYKFYLAERRPTQAHKDKKGPKLETTRLASFGPLYVFFQMYNLFVIFLLLALVLVLEGLIPRVLRVLMGRFRGCKMYETQPFGILEFFVSPYSLQLLAKYVHIMIFAFLDPCISTTKRRYFNISCCCLTLCTLVLNY